MDRSSSLLLVLDREGVLLAPAESHPPPLLLERVRGGRLEVLAHHLQLAAVVELDEVARDHPGVEDVTDAPLLDVVALALGIEPHLLGSHREAATAALEQVR